METLVDMAKRLGIKPNPRMRNDYYSDIVLPALRKEIEKLGVKGIIGLEDGVYEAHKYLPHARTLNMKTASSNVRSFKTRAKPQVRIMAQSGNPIGQKDLGKDLSFVWHSAKTHGQEYIERFQIDLKMDSPQLGQIFDQLDNFILKHHAGYKIVDLDGKKEHKRTDSLNLYMTKAITPEITKELYSIVSPVLEGKYDEFLAGLPVKLNGKNIKGFKYGPEPRVVGQKNEKRCADYIKMIASRDLPSSFVDFITNCNFEEEQSLGQLCSRIEKADLIYYLVGKEGKNPFQLGNQFGEPQKSKYDKIIDIGQTGQIHQPAHTSPKKTKTVVTMADLLSECRSLTSEIQHLRSEVGTLRNGNRMLRQQHSNLLSQNTQLRSSLQGRLMRHSVRQSSTNRSTARGSKI